MPFNRWLIEGTLTTRTALRIGNGDVTKRDGLINPKDNKKIEIGACATDIDERAYLPGSTLKGKLRAAAKELELSSTEELFGSEEPDDPEAVGGKAEFHDAPSISFGELVNPSPYWCHVRRTDVLAGVTLNRQRLTASDERLFHLEFVPPGVTFEVKISGQKLEDSEVDDLLRALEAFNDELAPIALGSSTGDGWGRMDWRLTSLKRMRTDEIIAWVASDDPATGDAMLPEIPENEFHDFLVRSQTFAERCIDPGPRVKLNLRLRMESHFLVNDPSRTKKTVDDDLPNHAPLRTVNGRAVLPASSLRGAIRSQAERILRTIGGVKAACYPDGDGPRPACASVYHSSELSVLCPACQIFGAPGWRAPLELTDFTSTAGIEGSEGVETKQEFVAIDRFTGGGSKGAKFNAVSVYKPVLQGSLTLDLAALARTGAGKWAIGLLILTLRDLAEGDVRLGFGAAKGYGAVKAEIEAWSLPEWEEIPEVYRDYEMKAEFEDAIWPLTLTEDAQIALMLWIDELKAVAQSAATKEAV